MVVKYYKSLNSQIFQTGFIYLLLSFESCNAKKQTKQSTTNLTTYSAATALFARDQIKF